MELHSLIAAIKRHAEDALPFECCGLIGRDNSIVRCTNEASNRTRNFVIPSHVIRHTERTVGVAGFYHSHVDQRAYLSRADIVGMTENGLYVIVGTKAGVATNVRAWQMCNGKVLEIML